MLKLSKKYGRELKKLRKRLNRLEKKNPRLIYGILLVVIIAVAIVGYAYLQASHSNGPSRLVTFHDRGENHVVLTRATTVKAALQDAGITVAPQDDVEPSLGSPINSTDSAVIIYRSRPVLVVDGAVREKVLTPAASPNEIALAAGVAAISPKDKTTLTEGNAVTDGVTEVLTIQRAVQAPAAVEPNLFRPTPSALSKSKGAQIYVDSSGVAHRETYYDLPMNLVMGACGGGDYTIRYDGAKIDKDGYVLVAANLAAYPRCTVVETSLGLGKVYDTGGFAARYPHGFDLATDWTNYNGR